ncbi:MAG: GNAT family N-acetyltransferase [Bacteroidia bacterium]|nr:GNAT family N-acetyltransferase [Bacteroidia bacterium]
MIKADYKDKSHIVNILTKVFDDNNSVNYVIKQDNKREQRIKKLMEYSFDICYLFGNVYLSEDRNACALTLFPDKQKTTLKTILLDLKLAYSSIGLTRIKKVQDRNSKIKNSYPKEPIFYLWFIGVNSTVQSKGIGSSLIKDLIKESEITKRPIYLETSMQKNIEFYNKHGFKVYKELDFGHKLFLIKRDVH